MNGNDSAKRIDSQGKGLADFIDLVHPDLFHKTTNFASFMRDLRARGHDPMFAMSAAIKAEPQPLTMKTVRHRRTL
jgi:anionic cell wall polymer biosynthesis LytR-Cps2A-Psr (LCP) family protein